MVKSLYGHAKGRSIKMVMVKYFNFSFTFNISSILVSLQPLTFIFKQIKLTYKKESV